jgi:hypothetical protein
VVFEEFNGSQAEQVVPSDVGYEESSQVIKSMGVGHILPCEDQVLPNQDFPHEEDSRSTQVEPSSTQVEPSSSSQVEQDSQEDTQAQEQPPSPQPHEQDQGDDQELHPLKIKPKKMVMTKTSHKKNSLVMMG